MTIGLLLDLIGCIGLVRFHDVYNRLQISTKTITLGTCFILFGMFVVVGPKAAGMKALLCIGFIVLTSPVAAHSIARGAHRGGVKLWEKSVVDKYKEDNEGENLK
jgi:multicomponent Na+:H+ antiporter subunit G